MTPAREAGTRNLLAGRNREELVHLKTWRIQEMLDELDRLRAEVAALTKFAREMNEEDNKVVAQLRARVAALIKERDALKQYKQGVDGIIHHLIESDSSLDHEWAGDKHGWGFAFEWIKWIAERLRAEQRATLILPSEIGSDGKCPGCAVHIEHVNPTHVRGCSVLARRADQRIPPGMTAEKLNALAGWIRATREYMVFTDADKVLGHLVAWAAWLEEQAEPGTAKETPTESSTMPEATQEEQPLEDHGEPTGTDDDLIAQPFVDAIREHLNHEQAIPGLPEGFRIARLRRSPSYGRKPPMTLLAELEPIAPQGEPE